MASFITRGLEGLLFPSGAVNPSTGTVYIAYPSASAGKIEVFLMAVNGELGVVLPPRPIAQDQEKERFLPALAVLPTGTIGILFYELDPQTRKIEVYLVQSGDRCRREFLLCGVGGFSKRYGHAGLSGWATGYGHLLCLRSHKALARSGNKVSGQGKWDGFNLMVNWPVPPMGMYHWTGVGGRKIWVIERRKR
ncbi:MAG: hypothetical protein ACUVQS_04680 [Candidatus Bipolaricaulaceae bacterium]